MIRSMRQGSKREAGSVAARWGRDASARRSCVVAVLVLSLVVCLGGALVTILVGNRLWQALVTTTEVEPSTPWPPDSATLTVAVSPGMMEMFQALADDFNSDGVLTPDGEAMQVRAVELSPQAMVDQSLRTPGDVLYAQGATPPFQALAPDSSLWLNQLERRWTALRDEEPGPDEGLIPIGNRRTSMEVRYAASPVVIAAWEDVARELGWPEEAVGWEDVQRKATEDPAFKWNHPSTNHASGLLATLAEFYAGANLTRGLTEEAATDDETLAYVQAVEATVRFYGESEDVIIEQLEAEGRDFLDAFVVQEQAVIRWNQTHPNDRLVAIYPAEGTLWADHPLALLALGSTDEAAVTDNQRRVFHAFAEFLTGPDAQRRLLAAGYRPADLSIPLDEESSPFADSDAVDWRQPQTTLQIPPASVVEVVQNVWWYTKRPTRVYLVVDTSGSMGGDKLARTQAALKAFVTQIRGDRDQVGLIEFGTGIKSIEPIEPLDDARRQVLMEQIDRMEADGETALLDAVWYAYDSLQQAADNEAINALVVMTDGQENASERGMTDLVWRFEEEGAIDVVVFTIAFGSGADEDLLERIAEAGDGQFRRAGETGIEELYRIISTYF